MNARNTDQYHSGAPHGDTKQIHTNAYVPVFVLFGTESKLSTKPSFSAVKESANQGDRTKFLEIGVWGVGWGSREFPRLLRCRGSRLAVP